jgi:hypothetical protein
MDKYKILKLVELKFELMQAEAKHKKELEKARENGSYAYAEGYYSQAMKDIDRLSEEINSIEL